MMYHYCGDNWIPRFWVMDLVVPSDPPLQMFFQVTVLLGSTFYTICILFNFSISINSYCSVCFLFIAERVGVHVVECACVIELPELKV